MLTLVSLGSAALIPAHNVPHRASIIRAAAADIGNGAQWLGTAAQVLLDRTLTETTDEKVSALLEAYPEAANQTDNVRGASLGTCA